MTRYQGPEYRFRLGLEWSNLADDHQATPMHMAACPALRPIPATSPKVPSDDGERAALGAATQAVDVLPALVPPAHCTACARLRRVRRWEWGVML